MSKVVLALAATSVGLGLVSLHLVKQLRDSDAAVAELKAQLAALEELRVTAVLAPSPAQPAAKSTEQPLEIVSIPVDKGVRKSAAVRASGSLSTAPALPMQGPSREDRMRMMREHRERQRQLMQDPEYREAMRVQARTNFARQYPGVIEDLGMDPQQADDFFDMLADQQLRRNELMEPLWAASGESSDPAAAQERNQKIQQAAADMQRQSEADFAARFGQDKLQAWKEYQSTMGMRYQLDHMRSTLAAQGLPLSEDVSKPMLKALAEAQQAEMQEYSTAANRAAAQPGMAISAPFDPNNMERQLEQTKKRNQRMLDAISSYLTYEQRSAIEKQQQAQLKVQEAQMRLIRERGDANPSIRPLYAADGQVVPVQP